MRALFVAAIAAIAVGFLPEAPAGAQTPGGKMPASAGVCASLQGLKSGLYELCVANCEAQGLDAKPGALKSVPTQVIFASYNRKMRDDDQASPCVKAPCPCSEKLDFDSAAPKPARIQRVYSSARPSPLRSVST